MRRHVSIRQANTLKSIVFQDRDVRRYFISRRTDNFSRNQTSKETAHPSLRPLPLGGHEPCGERELPTGEVNDVGANADLRRPPSSFAEHPEERFALAELLISEVRIRPDAAVYGEDSALAHEGRPICQHASAHFRTSRAQPRGSRYSSDPVNRKTR